MQALAVGPMFPVIQDVDQQVRMRGVERHAVSIEVLMQSSIRVGLLVLAGLSGFAAIG